MGVGPKGKKIKGDKFENELVAIATEHSFEDSFRMWGSNGLSRGLPEEVDVVIDEHGFNIWLQAKRHETTPSYVNPGKDFDIRIITLENGTSFTCIYAERFFELLKFIKENPEAPLELRTETKTRKTMGKDIIPTVSIGIKGQAMRRNHKRPVIVFETSYLSNLLNIKISNAS